MPDAKPKQKKYCSFCGRNDQQADRLLGPKPLICEECVALCVGILAKELPAESSALQQIRKATKCAEPA